METLENYIKAGDIVLPETTSKDGKLTFKQIAIAQNFELNCHAFTDAINNIISANGDFTKQFSSIWTEDTDEYFCVYYKNESNFLSFIEQALFTRIIEFDFNTKWDYMYFINCINEQIAQHLSYDGSHVTVDELKNVFEYLMVIQGMKYNLRSKERFTPAFKMKKDELINAGLPKDGLLSWLINFIRTKK